MVVDCDGERYRSGWHQIIQESGHLLFLIASPLLSASAHPSKLWEVWIRGINQLLNFGSDSMDIFSKFAKIWRFKSHLPYNPLVSLFFFYSHCRKCVKIHSPMFVSEASSFFFWVLFLVIAIVIDLYCSKFRISHPTCLSFHMDWNLSLFSPLGYWMNGVGETTEH